MLKGIALVSSRADTGMQTCISKSQYDVFFSVFQQEEINHPVTNQIWILEYMTASVITCNCIINFHQSKMVNQYILELETLEVGSLY